MGLDTVELIMAIEDEFGIVIPDSEAPQLARVGEIHAYILRVLGERGETPDADELWNRLRNIVADHLGVRLEDVTPSAHIVYDLGAD